MPATIAPEPYHELRHWKWIVQEIAKPVAAILVTVVLFGVMTEQTGFNGGELFIAFIAILLFALRAIGLWRVWQVRPLVADADTGILTVGQTGYWWLLTSDSSPDSISLNDVEIETDQSRLEQVLFNRSCETLTIVNKGGGKGRSFHSVRDPYRIVAIHKYWNGKATRLAEELVEEQRETNRLLRNSLRPPQFPGQP